ncbi:MAG: hypothetical protein FWE28_09005 [Oscillospiraceae bacterium]|nr:hypothetical protein [Oscillospiraceae bacterium]
MKRIFIVVAILALLFLTACASANQNDSMGTESQSESVPTHDEDFLPDWIRDMFDESDLASDRLLTMNVSADWASHSTLDDMLAGTMMGYYGLRPGLTHIVMAEVLDERVEWVDPTSPHLPNSLFYGEEHIPRYSPYTINRIRVLEVFKGDVTIGDVLDLGQQGGQIGNFLMESRNKLPLATGDVLVFFLNDPNYGNNLSTTLPMFLINPWQGAYYLPDSYGRAIAFGENLTVDMYEELESVSPDNHWFLPTIGDLADLQIQNFGQLSESFAAIVR